MNALITAAAMEIGKRHRVQLNVEPQMYVELKSERKKIDYVITAGGKALVGIEVNLYSVSGSKPSEVLGRAYPEVQASLRAAGVGFIVITDGVGWESMRPVITTAQKKIDHT